MKLEFFEKTNLLFLFSDTGGGHRSASEAIIEAINLEYPGRFNVKMVDVFRQYAPAPFNRAPEIYPPLTRMPDVWRLGYRASDGQRRTRYITSAFLPYMRRSLYRLIEENPADLYVSVHPLLNAPVIQAAGGQHLPFVTVVTDLVSTHAFWYATRGDLTIVPTEPARQRGLMMGLRPEQLEVVGALPVADRFCHPPEDRNVIRQRLGWNTDKPVILLVGGGDGMGPLEHTAHAIDRAHLPATMVIVAGRNQHLKERLSQRNWHMPVRIYGFTREMPDFMAASDVLVSKAGPGTICEAFIAGLPLILYSRLPGQEDGNVTYVVENNAGVWAPTAEEVVETLRAWLSNPERLKQAAQASHRLAVPDSARKIARLLAKQWEKATQESAVLA